MVKKEIGYKLTKLDNIYVYFDLFGPCSRKKVF